MPNGWQELLIDYFTGELDAERAAKLERALVESPKLAERFVRFGIDQFLIERALHMDEVGDLVALQHDDDEVELLGLESLDRRPDLPSLATLAEIESLSGPAEPVDITDRVIRERLKSRRGAANLITVIRDDARQAHVIIIPKVAVFFAIAAALAILASVVWVGQKPTGANRAAQVVQQRQVPHGSSENQAVVLGQVTDQLLARWEEDDREVSDGLIAGHEYSLLEGVVELSLADDVRLTIEGPARFTASDYGQFHIAEGRLCGKVPVSAGEFTITSPSARMMDSGGEFAVDVVSARQTHVQVFWGEARVGAIASASEPITLLAGEACGIADSRVQAAEYFEHTYFREMPSAYELFVRDLAPLAWWSFNEIDHGWFLNRGIAGIDAEAASGSVVAESLQGNAVFINGVQGAMPLAVIEPFNLTNNFTIETWIRVDGDTEESERIFSNRDRLKWAGFGFGLAGRDLAGKYRCLDADGYYFQFSPLSVKFSFFGRLDLVTKNPIPSGEWVQIVVVCSSDNPIQLYINGRSERVGVLSGSGASQAHLHHWQQCFPGDTTDTAAEIGRNPGEDAIEAFVGHIDELVIYREPLSDDVIRELYERGLVEMDAAASNGNG